jgi:Flp pilus assembly protein CpaB
LRRLGRQTRRHLVARRRLLAAMFAAVAVAAALRVLAPPEPATVAVPVAAHDLPAGTVLGTDDVATARMPEGLTPAGASSDPRGATLAAPVRRGEVLTDARLVGQPAITAPDGLVAAPVRLPDAQAAALLRAGDRIDLLATDARHGRTTQVAVGALVLGVPPGGEAAAGPLGGRIVLLALPVASVETVSGAAVTLVLTYVYAD